MRCSSMAAWVGCAGVLTAVGAASGQSVNIRFGTAATTPSATYSAAGLAGVWNSFASVPPDYVRQPLVSLAGTAIAARFYQSGSASVLIASNPLTSGDDKKLMDSMCLSTNSPTDGCFWVEGLTPGPYEVTMYAMTPNDAARLSRTRVDNGSPGPVMVGGAWPGHHQSGVTYSRFSVTTTDGVIAFHDGLYGGVLQSGINGVQLRLLAPCAPPTVSVQPASALACPTGSAPFAVTAAGALTYQWQIQTSPGDWRSMGNDPGPMPCGGGSFSYAGPINSANVTFGVRPCPAADRTVPQHFQIRCIISNLCGSIASNEATCTICPADFNCSGSVSVQDVFDFLGAYFSNDTRADVNGVGGISVQDIFDFLAAYFAGCS